MDDRPATFATPRQVFRCPRELHSIDRATHLGRVANFYPACLQCEHRHDIEGLSSIEARRCGEVGRRQTAAARFETEHFAGTAASGLDAATVHRLAAALGILVWRETSSRARTPAAVVGTDGHWSTAELFASACAALKWAGCRTLECGAVTGPALALLASQRQADAAVWIGNARGEPQHIALKFWGPHGSPWSSPGRLDLLETLWKESSFDRPCRSSGGSERASAVDVYLPSLAPMFHGLRPLRLVLDTSCQPLVRVWRELSHSSACEIVGGGQRVDGESSSAPSFGLRRLATVSRRVLASGAHFGMWIDGDGETCLLVDERGRAVSSERLLLALAEYVCRRQPGAHVLLESAGSGECQRRLEGLGAKVSRAPSNRQAMSESFVERCAVLAGGPSGRYWFGSSPPAPDALLALCFWLTVLSQSDRPASEVLDAAEAGGYKGN